MFNSVIRSAIMLMLSSVFLLGHSANSFAFGGDEGEKSESGKSDSGSNQGGDKVNNQDQGGQGNKTGGRDDGSKANPPGSGSSSNTGVSAVPESTSDSQIARLGRVVNQDEALGAISSGKAVSLPLLLAYMSNKFPGEIVDIKLRAKDYRYSYEVKYLLNAVILKSVVLNAQTLNRQ